MPKALSQKVGSEPKALWGRLQPNLPFANKVQLRIERTLIFCKKNQSKRYIACSDVVRLTGIEPARRKAQEPNGYVAYVKE